MTDIKKRAELGKAINEKTHATGEPGTPQPEHKDTRASVEDTVAAIDDMIKLTQGVGTEPRESSAARSKSGTGNHPVPPEDRTSGVKDQQTAQLDAAAGHLSAARTAVTTQLTADAALLSDPRYERDQKVFDMGRAGKLGEVEPPSEEAEVPSTSEEQATEDLVRLENVDTEETDGTSTIR